MTILLDEHKSTGEGKCLWLVGLFVQKCYSNKYLMIKMLIIKGYMPCMIWKMYSLTVIIFNLLLHFCFVFLNKYMLWWVFQKYQKLKVFLLPKGCIYLIRNTSVILFYFCREELSSGKLCVPELWFTGDCDMLLLPISHLLMCWARYSETDG